MTARFCRRQALRGTARWIDRPKGREIHGQITWEGPGPIRGRSGGGAGTGCKSVRASASGSRCSPARRGRSRRQSGRQQGSGRRWRQPPAERVSHAQSSRCGAIRVRASAALSPSTSVPSSAAVMGKAGAGPCPAPPAIAPIIAPSISANARPSPADRPEYPPAPVRPSASRPPSRQARRSSRAGRPSPRPVRRQGS